MIGLSGEIIDLSRKLGRVTKQDRREDSAWPTPVNQRELWPVVASVVLGIALAAVLVWFFI